MKSSSIKSKVKHGFDCMMNTVVSVALNLHSQIKCGYLSFITVINDFWLWAKVGSTDKLIGWPLYFIDWFLVFIEQKLAVLKSS